MAGWQGWELLFAPLPLGDLRSPGHGLAGATAFSVRSGMVRFSKRIACAPVCPTAYGRWSRGSLGSHDRPAQSLAETGERGSGSKRRLPALGYETAFPDRLRPG